MNQWKIILMFLIMVLTTIVKNANGESKNERNNRKGLGKVWDQTNLGSSKRTYIFRNRTRGCRVVQVKKKMIGFVNIVEKTLIVLEYDYWEWY